MLDLSKPLAFEWDDGNSLKNQIKHNVEMLEAEQVFFNQPLIVFEDKKHSQLEERLIALGKTNLGRQLSLSFTMRFGTIRIISARNMSRRERKSYEADS